MTFSRLRTFFLHCLPVMLGLFTLSPSGARATDQPGFMHDDTLTICVNPTLPPMIFVAGADASTTSGVDIDLAQALARYWHARLVVTPMDFVGLFPSLAAQRCGMVISGIIKLPEREKNFDAVSYFDTALAIVARAGTTAISSMADLSGKTVAIQTGTSYAVRIERENERLIAAGRPPIIIQQYPTEDQVVQQLLIGRVFAFASQDVELYYRQKQLHGKVNIILTPDYPEYRHFGIYIRQNAADREKLATAMAALQADGTITAIKKKWAISDNGKTAFAQNAQPPAFRWDTFFAALRSGTFIKGACITLSIAMLSHLVAILIAIPMAIALNGSNSITRQILRIYVSVFRGAPTLLQLLFIWNALPQFLPIFREEWFTPFLATWLALSINESAYQVEINRAALSAVDKGQEHAADVLGMNRRQVYFHVIFPQALRIALPPTINEFINLIKTTSLASVISLQELLAVTQVQVARTFEFTEYYAVALVYYLAMVFFFLFIQKRVERRFSWADRQMASANDTAPRR